MQRFDFSSLINNINDNINYYKYEKLQYNQITLFLANGEKLVLSTPMSSVAHLLGVDTDYLLSTKIFRETSYGIY